MATLKHPYVPISRVDPKNSLAFVKMIRRSKSKLRKHSRPVPAEVLARVLFCHCVHVDYMTVQGIQQKLQSSPQ
jgi:hypothetical protein